MTRGTSGRSSGAVHQSHRFRTNPPAPVGGHLCVARSAGLLDAGLQETLGERSRAARLTSAQDRKVTWLAVWLIPRLAQRRLHPVDERRGA